MDVRAILAPPNHDHILGTDSFGRDVFARLAHGGRASLLVGFCVAIFSGFLGMILGLLTGFFPRLDSLLSRVVDAWLSFPPIILGMVIMAMFGSSIVNLILALSVCYGPRISRVIRSVVCTVRERDFVTAAIAVGASPGRVLLRHVMPSTLAAFIVQTSLTFATAVLAEAVISFIGLGVTPPTPSWGNMLSEARPHILDCPWLMLPGVAITMTVLGINICGDGLRDVFDPRLRGR